MLDPCQPSASATVVDADRRRVRHERRRCAVTFPRDRLPEVALVGRSNVGKSSLINALVRQPLARTSAAPGKTRLANFYRVQRGIGAAVLPGRPAGYGYARRRRRRRATEFDALDGRVFRRAPGDDRIARAAARGLRGTRASTSDLDAWEWLAAQPCAARRRGTKVDKLTRRNARVMLGNSNRCLRCRCRWSRRARRRTGRTVEDDRKPAKPNGGVATATARTTREADTAEGARQPPPQPRPQRRAGARAGAARRRPRPPRRSRCRR